MLLPALSAIALPLSTTLAQTQSVAFVNSGFTNAATECTNGQYYQTVVHGAGSTSASCAANYTSMSASGSNIAGSLVSRASVSSPGAPAGSVPAGQTFAENWWTDAITFAPGSTIPSFVRLTSRYAGTLNAYHFGDMGGSAGTSVGGTFSLWNGNGQSQTAYAQHQVMAGYQNPEMRDAEPLDAQSFDELLTLMIPVGASQLVSFSMQLRIDSYIGGGFSWMDIPAEFGTGDYSASIASIEFLDAQQGVIGEGVEYSFNNQTQLTSTPEPSSLILMATGVVAGALIRRRRRI